RTRGQRRRPRVGVAGRSTAGAGGDAGADGTGDRARDGRGRARVRPDARDRRDRAPERPRAAFPSGRVLGLGRSQDACLTDLRADGPAALEWAARYLERLGELPVLAQVAPGEIRKRLPDTAPE